MSLDIEGEVLHAREPGGSTWHINLARVRLIRWSGRELELELAGEVVAFVPEDPESTLAGLVPALGGSARPPAAAVEQTPAPPTGEPPAGTPHLVVDLTAAGAGPSPRPVAPVRSGEPPLPATVWPDEPRPGRTRTRERRKGLGRAVVWATMALAIAAGVAVIASGGSDGGVEDRARAALDEAGLSSVAVVVKDGTATLTGTVTNPDLAESAAAAVSVIDGIENVVDEIDRADTTPPPTTPEVSSTTVTVEPIADRAGAALIAAGVDSATVETAGGLLVVSGAVASEGDRRKAIAALGGVAGVEQIDDRLTIAAVPDDTVASAARTALDEAGFEAVAVAVEDGIATLTGVVPLSVLERGFFRYSDRAEAIVVEQAGVVGIRNRLQLTGDAATLRDQLLSLTESAPITFGLGASTLSDASRATLDEAAAVIQAQPGLRVLIAGHTDTTGSAGFNEQLSQERADAVRRYLVERGIAANRLVVVAYGELFPSSPGEAPLDRRVEFEVAG